MTDNPFVYGEIVPDASFVGRDAEMERLVADLAGGQKVFLISPRRYGKSSLVRQALKALARRGALTVAGTVRRHSSYVSFLEGYARALASLETRRERARSWLAGGITSTRPEVRYDARVAGLGGLSVSFAGVQTARDVSRLANELFALPGRIAADRKRSVV